MGQNHFRCSTLPRIAHRSPRFLSALLGTQSHHSERSLGVGFLHGGWGNSSLRQPLQRRWILRIENKQKTFCYVVKHARSQRSCFISNAQNFRGLNLGNGLLRPFIHTFLGKAHKHERPTQVINFNFEDRQRCIQTASSSF